MDMLNLFTEILMQFNCNSDDSFCNVLFMLRDVIELLIR
jgi:hypothetical protein